VARAGHDPYYSRIGQRWELAERLDPVVWPSLADARPGPLAADQLARYERDGFLVSPGLLAADEVRAIVDEAERMALAADRSRDDVVAEPDSEAIRSLFRVHRESRSMQRLCADLRLAGAARQLLGDEVYIHQSRINFKPPFEGRSFPWHSDFETWHLEDGMPRMRALSASILLTDNTEHNGPLLIVPGSHRRYVRCVGETPDEHYRQSLRHQSYGVPDREALAALVEGGGIESVTGPAGTVVFFDCNVMHGSAGNITPLPRHNVFVCFNSVSNRLVEPFAGTRPRPDFLAERETLSLTV
jgi:ectoine hydroxylase